jgi:hypothetical protein
MQIVFDCETYALPSAAEFMEEPTAPANYKDPAKIEAYIAEARQGQLAKAALDIDLCSVIAIGVQIGDAPPSVMVCQDEAEEKSAITQCVGRCILALPRP